MDLNKFNISMQTTCNILVFLIFIHSTSVLIRIIHKCSFEEIEVVIERRDEKYFFRLCLFIFVGCYTRASSVPRSV